MKQIVRRWINGSTIYEGEHDTFKEAVEHCAKNDICMRGADMRGARMQYADMQGAKIDKKWCITTISPIGSENGQLCTIDNQDGRGIIYNRGCFSGTEAEFIAAIAKKHGGTAIEREYLAAIAFVKVKFGVEEVER